jgi:XTP/dITP diphosphohydrolase
MKPSTPSHRNPIPTPAPTIIVLATGNPHKVREISAIMNRAAPQAPLRFVAASEFSGIEEPEETGETFEENALLKARYWAARTGYLAVADDSGLVVDALEWRPGVLSARYETTAERRNERVLRELRGVPPGQRTARFVCVAALADPQGEAQCVEGRIEGWIIEAARGTGGFGYDPIFEPARASPVQSSGRAGRTLAEYSEAEKNEVSHRGRAFAELAPRLVRAAASGRVERLR